MLISDNGVSKVVLSGEYIYKYQPKFLCDNEIWILKLLYPSGYVPQVLRIATNAIRLQYIEPMPVTNPDVLMWHFSKVLRMLQYYEIRHGDLTDKNIIVNNNKPYIIDWSESRLACDPREDKRPEGDEHWLKESFERLCNARD